MVKEHGLTVSLEEFGLSKYEAKAYVTLVSHGTISASEVAYYSNLPRTKVYPTLLKLDKKRLVIISKSKPIMCTAIAPEDAFDDIIQEHIDKVNQMNTLVTKLKRASEESKKTRGAEEKRYFHLSSNNVLNQLKIMIGGTKSSIQVIVDPWGLNLLAECKEQLLLVLRRNVDVKIIVSPTQIGSESFHTIPSGAKIKVMDTAQNCFIFDQTEVLLIDSDNGKGAVFSATDVLGISQTKVFVQMWDNALKTDGLYDMAKSDAQAVYHIIQLVNENGLGFI
ncbi:MAG: helix-turn-helix domain-containing protein, partial [Thermoproteota archaeon]